MINTFISKISGKTYKIWTKEDKALFEKELKAANLTRETYADKYFKNLSDKKHQRELKPGEFYLYKKISFTQETYEKVIIDKKWKCELCENFYATNTSSFWSHVSRVHHLTINEYLEKINYKPTTEKVYCSFCGKEAEFSITLDPENKTYTKIYKQPRCNTYECNDKLCVEFFGKHYKDCKKQFEHIGGKTEYLCKLYKTDKKGLKKLGKSKCAKFNGVMKSDLNGFISLYGIEEGTKRYYERCKKSAFALTEEYYIKKYGKEIGRKKYLDRMLNRGIGSSSSKGQYKLYSILNENNNFKLEYQFEQVTIDLYNEEKNVVIEYFGDFWHANPKIYKNDWVNPVNHNKAEDIRKKDEKRINFILKNLNSPFIIIVWESSFWKINENDIKNQINEFINNENNKGKILWI